MNQENQVTFPYEFEEEQRFTSSLSRLNSTLDSLKESTTTATEVNEEQESEIQDTKEIDVEQAEQISNLEKAVSSITLSGATTEYVNNTVASAQTAAQEYTDKQIKLITSGAPEAFDTLKEIADWIDKHGTEAIAMSSAITKNANDIATLQTEKVDKQSLSAYSTSEEIANTYQVKGDYALKSEIPSLSGYATEEWVENKNYLTEHQSLSAYSTSEEIANTYQVKGDYALKSEIPSIPTKVSAFENDANYLTEHQSLSAYSTSEEIANTYQVKGDYATKDEIPSIPTKVSAFENDANYLTEHQSLSAYSTSEEIANAYQVKGNYATKDEIPSVEGLAKSSDVAKEMSKLLTRIEVLEKAQTNLVVASSAEDIAKITDPSNTSLVLTSQEAIESLSAKTLYKTLAIVGGDTEKSINIAATDSVVVDGLTINGAKDSGNGKINFSANTIEIKNVEVQHGSTSYNVFEGSQVTSTTEFFTENLNASNINVDDVLLTHNVINVYTPAENAKITISDSNFNLNVANSNILRMSNYGNSKNVVVTFENVNWTYENVETSESDWAWAGLVIYQPAGADVLLSGDTSAISTWTFNFKNCKYNGEKVTENSFGKHSQVIYMYNVGGTKTISDPSSIEGLKLNFE